LSFCRRLKKNKEKQEELKEKMMMMQGQGLAEEDPNAIKVTISHVLEKLTITVWSMWTCWTYENE
jgi:hypothetical protein